MEIYNYKPSNLTYIDFPFKIEDPGIYHPTAIVKINDIELEFPNIDKYWYMWYSLKRQNDFKLIPEKSEEIYKWDDFEKYIVFDSAFNVIGNFTYTERNSHAFEMFIKKFKRDSEKALWGSIIDSDTLKYGKSKIVKYVLESTGDYTTKVMIQPEGHDWDEGYFVYVHKENRANRFLNIAYVFQKYEKSLIADEIISDGWIY